MSKRSFIIGSGMALCAAGSWPGNTPSWQYSKAVPMPQAPIAAAPVPVVAQKVGVSDFPIVMTGIGAVEAYNVVDVHAQVTGTIQKIDFVEGQTVHPGSLIAQLDPRPFQAAPAGRSKPGARPGASRQRPSQSHAIRTSAEGEFCLGSAGR